MDFNQIEFADPAFFWLLCLLPGMIFYHIWKEKKRQGSLRLSSSNSFKENTLRPFFNWGGGSAKFTFINLALRCLSLAALVTAIARPQLSLSWKNTTTQGIDIVIASDISGSMLAEDLKPNRLEAGKNIAIEFIKNRPDDRIGLIVFSGESFTQCPLTIDHEVLINLYSQIRNGMLQDGTAIGMGLATAVNRLKDSEAKSKVIILLTDGSNNMGSIPPLTAGEIAKQFNIRVYTVGIGTNGYAPYPVPSPFGGVVYQKLKVDIDEPLLKKIASETGGSYFRATDNKKLKEIYERIDQMEKAKIDVTQYRRKTEYFLPFALIALGLLLVEYILKNTLFKGALT